MKMKGALLALIFTIATVLTGCENPLAVFDPKGPMAATLADDYYPNNLDNACYFSRCNRCLYFYVSKIPCF